MNRNSFTSVEITHSKGWLKLTCKMSRSSAILGRELVDNLSQSFPSFIESFNVLYFIIKFLWAFPQQFSEDNNRAVFNVLFRHRPSQF